MGGPNLDFLLNTVGDVYEAALNPELWPFVVNTIADMIGAESTHLMVANARTGKDSIGFLERQDPATLEEYMNNYFQQDIRATRLAATPTGKIIRDRELWTEEERLTSPLYQDYQRVHKLYEITGAPLGIEGHLAWLGFSRNTPSPFEDDDIRIINLVAPHFRQSVRIALEIGAANARTNVLGHLWSLKGRGVLVVTPDGKVSFANAEAEALGAEGVLRLSTGGVFFSGTTLNKYLAANLSALREGLPTPAAFATGLTISESGEQIGVRFMPTASGGNLSSGMTACLLVVLTPLSKQAAPNDAEISQFTNLYALSLSEQKVLQAALSGTDLATVARQRGVKLDTVRRQMKAVLSKTHCRSQKDLFRMVERFCFIQLR